MHWTNDAEAEAEAARQEEKTKEKIHGCSKR